MTTADYQLPCIHAGPLPGDRDHFLCKLGVADNPSLGFCRDRCRHNMPPGIHEQEVLRASWARKQALAAGIDAEPSRGRGLGDWVESGINFLTLGQGRRVASKRNTGKAKPGGCSKCRKRQSKLNKAGRAIAKKLRGKDPTP